MTTIIAALYRYKYCAWGDDYPIHFSYVLVCVLNEDFGVRSSYICMDKQLLSVEFCGM